MGVLILRRRQVVYDLIGEEPLLFLEVLELEVQSRAKIN